MKEVYSNIKDGLTKDWNFKKRVYHPPGDCFNAYLSLGFTIFYSYLIGEVIASGLDPYISFFHKKRGEHAILASDLIEPIRPLIVFYIFSLASRNIISVNDCVEVQKSFFISKEQKKVFLKEISNLLVSNIVQEKINIVMKTVKGAIQRCCS